MSVGLMAAFIAPSEVAATQTGGDTTQSPRRLAGLTIPIPPGAEVTTRSLSDKVDVVAITRGSEVLLLTIYRAKISATRALETTVDELAEQVRATAIADSIRVTTTRIRMFKRKRAAKRLDYAFKVGGNDKKMQAFVVAARARGRVVVASWNAPRRDMSAAFSPKVVAKVMVSSSSPPLRKTLSPPKTAFVSER